MYPVKQPWIAAALVGVLTWVTAACGAPANKPAAPSSGPRPTASAVQSPAITIGLAAFNMALTPPQIALQEGYFQKQGLSSVKVVRLNGSVVTAASLRNGSIQVALTGAAPFLTGQAKGLGLLAVAAIDRGFTSSVLVTPKWAKEHPVPPNATLAEKIQSLRGAVMGQVSTTDLAVAKAMLAYAHLPSNSVHFLSVQNQEDELTALQHNQIDAAIFSPPQSFEAQAKGWARILFNARDLPALSSLPYDVVATTPAFAKEHPATLRKVLAAIEEGVATLNSRSPAVLRFEEHLNPGVPPDVVKATLDFIEMTPYTPMTAEQWQGLNRFLVSGGLLKQPYTMKEGVDWTNQFLPQKP
jgi:ABC-type nitrate/sulfonate/bicarbonate transport system substrate-binding protein